MTMPINSRERLFPSRIIFLISVSSILQLRLSQMCCEQMACYVAVFDHTEAVCYLKGAAAVHTYDYADMEGFTSHEMLFREGVRVSTRGTQLFFLFFFVVIKARIRTYMFDFASCGCSAESHTCRCPHEISPVESGWYPAQVHVSYRKLILAVYR